MVEPPTVAAGEASALFFVELLRAGVPVAASAGVEVTLDTSSARAGFLVKLEDPIARPMTLVIPAGSSRGAFYYRDFAAGVATLSATSEAYAQAHATVEVTPAAKGRRRLGQSARWARRQQHAGQEGEASHSAR